MAATSSNFLREQMVFSLWRGRARLLVKRGPRLLGFRHSYRSGMDKTYAPITVQKELMRHASIQTTMNVYGGARREDKRKAHSKVVEMIPKPTKSEGRSGESAVFCYRESVGVD